MKHSNIDYSIANRIMSTSKRCYTMTRNLLVPVLPHPVSLQRMFAFFRLTPGFIVQTFQYLLKKSELDSWKPSDFLLSFCFDECTVAHVGMLNMHTEQVVGPHKEAFVIMARALAGNWQVPIYINFDVAAKIQVPQVKIQLVEIYKDTIIEFEKINFKVLLSVCDQGGKNQALSSHFGITPDNFCIPNPYQANREVIFIHDFVHEVKLMRNHVITDTFKLPSGKTSSKKDFSALIDASKKSSVSVASTVLPLNDYCLNLKGSDRQDVGTALKLFSRETASAFRKFYPNDEKKLELAELCETIGNGRNCNQ